MSAAIAFFNNKGGVGKTTLACNFAAYAVAKNIGFLIVDLDPQCNSTQLVLTEEQWGEIYGEVDKSDAKTVLGPLRPIREEGTPALMQRTFRSSEVSASRPMSYQAIHRSRFLRTCWAPHESEFGGGRPGGARRTGWLRALRQAVDPEYDVLV